MIVTDSSYAIRIFHQVQMDHNPINYHGYDNFDLILMLCNCFHEKSDVFAFQVKKIASHQDVENNSSLLEKYAILGNQMADQMAKSTTVENRSNFHRASWFLGRMYGKQRQNLRQYLRLLVEIDILRQEVKSKNKDKDKIQSSRAYTDDLAQWAPAVVHRPLQINLNDEFLSGFLPGANVMIAMIRWAQMLQWPQEESSACLGISHVELVINFMVVTAQSLPSVLQRVGKFSEYRDPILFPEAALLRTIFGMMSEFWSIVLLMFVSSLVSIYFQKMCMQNDAILEFSDVASRFKVIAGGRNFHYKQDTLVG